MKQKGCADILKTLDCQGFMLLLKTLKNIAVFHATHAPCHTCPPAMHAPFHGHPLPCMPPATHTPCHACLPTTHAPLPCTSPSMDTPCHACPLPHMPPCHACPLPHFVVGGNYSKSSENQYRWLSSPQYITRFLD